MQLKREKSLHSIDWNKKKGFRFKWMKTQIINKYLYIYGKIEKGMWKIKK